MYIWELEYFQGPRKNGSLLNNLILCSLLKNVISPCGCQRADFETVSLHQNFLFPLPVDGGPDWTRTSDPTLIKRVL